MRELRYQATRRALEDLLSDGPYPAGALLPSESELAAELDASRVTVRRALTLLKDEGIVNSRQGLGWFVVGDRVPQSLDRLTSLDEQLAGRQAHRELLTFEVGKPPVWVRELLGTDRALHIVRRNSADGHPIGRNSAWAPADLAADITLAAAEKHSLHRLLPVTLARAQQAITAVAASTTDADLLGVPKGLPLLCARRTTYDDRDRVALVSEAVYNPARTEYVVDLTAAAADSARLRLIR